MADSNIEWTDRVWNPTRGCTRVSEGCRNCYAERQAIRQGGPGGGYEGLVRSSEGGPRWTGKVVVVANKWDEPSHWAKPSKIFVNSMSDLFHEALTDGDVDRIFGTMALKECDRHTFQVLTKRPQRMRDFLTAASTRLGNVWPWNGHTLRNAWLGVSVENQKAADERIPLLLQTPTAVRFLSVEPMLGPVDLGRWLEDDDWGFCNECLKTGPLTPFSGACGSCGSLVVREGRSGLSWVIVGGESGPGARPCELSWIRSVVEQCQRAAIPVFVKQLGAIPSIGGYSKKAPGCWNPKHPDVAALIRLTNKKGGDMAEWPADLRVREFPDAR